MHTCRYAIFVSKSHPHIKFSSAYQNLVPIPNHIRISKSCPHTKILSPVSKPHPCIKISPACIPDSHPHTNFSSPYQNLAHMPKSHPHSKMLCPCQYLHSSSCYYLVFFLFNLKKFANKCPCSVLLFVVCCLNILSGELMFY